MTAKENAKELIRKCFLIVPQPFREGAEWNREWISEMVKQCALICVDEIIKEIDGKTLTDQSDYWEEVKQEINSI